MKAKIYLKDVDNRYGDGGEMGQLVVADYDIVDDRLVLAFKGRSRMWGGGWRYWVPKECCVIMDFNIYYDSIF